MHAWYVDADQVATLRELLAGSGWLERARIFGRALRTTPKSAGGLLVGYVANARPELWAGIIAEVPFVDNPTK